MKEQAFGQTVERKKIVAIGLLFLTTVAIMLFGVSFSVFSMVKNVSFLVLQTQIHGAIFGVVITFLGVRYFLAVRKLKAEVFKKTSQFSWSNFKKK